MLHLQRLPSWQDDEGRIVAEAKTFPHMKHALGRLGRSSFFPS
jgi:hypothetical protein